MATFRKADDEIVSCPYNVMHLIRKSRLQAHMIKCRESCLEEDKRICPFNATHRISEADFQKHIVICEDKAAIDKKVFEAVKPSAVYYKGRTAVPSYSAFKISQNEDWDDDDNHGHQALNEAEHSPKSENTKHCNELQAENSSRSSFEFSNNSEEKTSEVQSNVSPNWKAKDFMGMGRGQAILERLCQSRNQNEIQQPKNQIKVPVGRGRGCIFSDLIHAEHSVGIVKENMKSESVAHPYKSQADDSSDSSSACTSSEDDKSCSFQPKDTGEWISPNVIGIGRGRALLQHLRQPTHPNRAQKPVDETEIPFLEHQNGFQPDMCQNVASLGRSRGFVSNSRGKKLFVSNSRIVAEKEHLLRRSNNMINDESTPKLKYSIDHLPPCKPGEIRSVPLFCE